ncbi:MAG: endonuclease domain-containing protein [Dehalococcoidia bacterium]
MKRTTIRARALRKNPTDVERTLWRHLRLRQFNGFKFRRQRPIGPYIVDFVCLEKRLIVELDGGQHFDQRGYDSRRSQWLAKEGFRVIRFWDNQVLRDIDAVKMAILNALDRQS